MEIKLNKYSSLFAIIYTFPIWNLIVNWLFTDSIRFNIWRIYVILFFMYCNWYFLSCKKNIFKILTLNTFIGFSALYILLKGNGISYFFHNDVYLFWFLIISLLFWSDKNMLNKFVEYTIVHKKIPVINAALTVFSSLVSIIYGNGFILAQRTIVFVGVYPIEHALAYHVIVSYIMLLLLELYDSTSFHIFWKTALSIILMISGVRSTLLVWLVLILVDLYRINLKYKIIILSAVLSISLIITTNVNILYNIPMISKTVEAAKVGDVSNGRDILTSYGLTYYSEQTTLSEKLFGITMKKLRQVYWGGLHAHNDYVNILLGYGLISIIYVIYLLLKFIKGKNSIILLFIICILATFNGLFMYTEMVVSLPILKIAINSKKFKHIE